jgi:single-strand DNA-binding protein
MNVLSFTGNLGNDCRMGQAGQSTVCNFTVAVKSGFGQSEQTLWIDCALWGKQAESKLPDYLVKGQQVAVSGELDTCQAVMLLQISALQRLRVPYLANWRKFAPSI